MKRAAVALLALVLLAPAALAGERTRIVDRTWKVEMNWSGERQSVDPGGTLRHCPGDEVSTLYFRGKMVHPSRRHVDYTVYWSHDGRYDGQIDRRTYRHGRIRGWTARFGRGYLGDHPIGKSSIRLETVDGPAC